MTERARPRFLWLHRALGSTWGTVAALMLVTVVVEFSLMVFFLPALGFGRPGAGVALLDATLLGLGMALAIRPLIIGPLRRQIARVREHLVQSVAMTADTEGDEFYEAMTRCLGERLDASFVGVGHLTKRSTIEMIKGWTPHGPPDAFEYDPTGAPCALVAGGELCCISEDAASRLPEHSPLRRFDAASYIGVPIVDSGAVIGVVVVVRDQPMTDMREATALVQLMAARASAEIRRERASRAEAAANRRRNAIMRLVNETCIVSTTDRTGKITHTNDLFSELAGYRREELLGQDHRVVNSGRHPKTMWRDLYSSAASGRVWQARVCNRRKDGSEYWLQAGVIGITDENGKLEEMVSVRHDITEIIQAQQKANALLASIDASRSAMCVIDAEGVIGIANRSCRKLYELSDEEIGKRAFWEIIDEPAAKAAIEEAMASGERIVRRLRVRRAPAGPPGDLNLLAIGRDEDRVWLEIEISPVKADQTGSRHFICVMRNVDAQVRDEARLRLEAEGRRVQLDIATLLEDETSELEERLSGCVRSMISMEGLELQAKGGVFLRDGEGLSLCVTEGEYSKEFYEREQRIERGACLCGRALADADEGRFDVMISDDCACDPHDDHQFEGMTAHGHYIVPLHWAGRCEGVLFLYTEPHPVRDPARIELLTRIGEQVGAAIVRHRLHTAALRDSRETALVSDFAALRGAVSAVLRGGGMPMESRVYEVLDYVCTAEGLGFSNAAAVFVAEPAGLRLLAQHGEGMAEDSVPLPLVHHGETLGELVIAVEPNPAIQTIRGEFLAKLAEMLAETMYSDGLERRAEQARREKQDILFTMGRELRSPMTSIIAAADMLQERGVAAEELTELASMIQRNADHLLSVVDNVLDLSGIGTQSAQLPTGTGKGPRELHGARVLLLEHEEGAAESCAAAMREVGALVEVSRRPEIGVAMALGAVRAGRPHALVLMTELAASTEVELAPRLLRENGFGPPIIVLGTGDPDSTNSLRAAGADLVLPPGPSQPGELLFAAAEMLSGHWDRQAA